MAERTPVGWRPIATYPWAKSPKHGAQWRGPDALFMREEHGEVWMGRGQEVRSHYQVVRKTERTFFAFSDKGRQYRKQPTHWAPWPSVVVSLGTPHTPG